MSQYPDKYLKVLANFPSGNAFYSFIIDYFEIYKLKNIFFWQYLNIKENQDILFLNTLKTKNPNLNIKIDLICFVDEKINENDYKYCIKEIDSHFQINNVYFTKLHQQVQEISFENIMNIYIKGISEMKNKQFIKKLYYSWILMIII